MKKMITILFFFLFSGLNLVLHSAPQFSPEELAQRPFWEDFLRTAKILRGENIGEGVTKPKRLFLKKGEMEATAVWKSPTGTDARLFDKWQCEIAAYRLDKLLGVNMVPPTVERRYRMYSGSLQLWVDLPMSERKMVNEKISVPAEKADHYEKMRDLQRAFDSLIANSDRSLQNLCYTPEWRMLLIDHSRAFRDSYPYLNRLIYGKNGLLTTAGFSRLPRKFVENLRALNLAMISKAIESYLTGYEIEAILVRQKLLLKEIDETIKERGEAAVLYD